MKKYLLLFWVFLFTLSNYSKASHILGGTVYWECLSNGKYQFFTEIYRDCSGIQLADPDLEIKIFGSYLPLDSNGNPFSSIDLYQDQVKWNSANNGYLMPKCDTSKSKNYLSCENRDNGAIQNYYFNSKAISLKGYPPKDGWKFILGIECCRAGGLANVFSKSYSAVFQAIMYPTKNNDLIDSCFYSSAKFANPPTMSICIGANSYYNTGIQDEGDSISYSWGHPLWGIATTFTTVDTLEYKPGFSHSNPTPDSSFNKLNKSSELDSKTGTVNLALFNNLAYEKYVNVIRADSWRDGKVITSVYRETTLFTIQCDSLFNKEINNPPEVFINGKQQNNYYLDIQAGKKIILPIQVNDNDVVDTGLSYQTLSLKPFGQSFSADFTDTINCDSPPCAILKNIVPTYDSALNGYFIKGNQNLTTTFEWQTNCSHLGNNSNSKTYTFYYQVQDDHCPLPKAVSGTIQITLNGNNTFSKGSMKCVSEVNGGNEVGWNYNTISTENLIQWYIYGSTVFNSSYQLLDSLSPNTPLSYFDSNLNNQYYYVRAKNYACDSSISISASSDTLKKENGASSVESTIDCILLKWDEERTSYSDNELRRDFIYRDTPQSTGFELIDTVINTNQYCDNYALCGNTISYYVVGDNTTSVCNFKADTVSITTLSEIRANLIVSFDSNLWAYDPIGNYQWYDCSAQRIITGETDRVFIPKDTGLYALILSRFGCADTSNCLPFFPVGLEELPFSQAVSIYPNPTNGLVHIKLEKSTKQVNVLVRNIQGQLLQERQIVNSQSFQLELPEQAGIYFIQLTNSKGERANLKVVKQ